MLVARSFNLLQRRRFFKTGTAFISARHYTTATQTQEALAFKEQPGTLVSFNSYFQMLEECKNVNSLGQVHARLLINGLEQNVYLGTKLVNMYAFLGDLDYARRVFDKTKHTNRNSFLWNAMIRGYSSLGLGAEALGLYYQMLETGLSPDNFTYTFVLKACANIGGLQEGKNIHYSLIKNRHDSNVFVATALVDMYAKCGCLEFARQVFDKMPDRNVVLWSAMIGGYGRNGYVSETLGLFHEMLIAGVEANSITMVGVASACEILTHAKWIHGHVIKRGLNSDVSVGNAVIDMYARCGRMEMATLVFDKMCNRDIVSWSVMIVRHNQNGNANEALVLFHQLHLMGVKLDSIIMASVLPACACLGVLQHGQEIHAYIISSGFESDVCVGNALIDMYAKCGRIDRAQKCFDGMVNKDVITWSALIGGYTQNGYASNAMELFCQLPLEGMAPNSVTLVSVLPAFGHLGALQQGKWVHAYIIRNGFDSEDTMGNALLDMYAKCGSVETARRLFDKMYYRDVVTWNSMIAGYGMYGYGKDAITLFSHMQQTGIQPDHVTFLGVLSACRHAGLVDEGRQCFNCISQDYGITPTLEHYACMVDLLGRAGCLDEAHDLIKRMPITPGASIWGALLFACRIHSNIKLAELASERLLQLEPNNSGNYVLLSNIYASVGRWKDVTKMRTMLKNSGVKKTPGCSWIEIQNKVHSFAVGCRSHPQLEEIYLTLERLAAQMKLEGYTSERDFVLHDVEEEEKAYILCGHSEKLAMAFGLINTKSGTTIRITKNVRVCGDCHTATKFISKIVGREIIMRDANRFHHFKDGFCTCRDYW